MIFTTIICRRKISTVVPECEGGGGEDEPFRGGATMDERVYIYGEDIFSSAGVNEEKEWYRLKVNELKLHLSVMEVKVEQTKLHDKIRRLNRKNANIESKEKDGNEMTFSKPHEQMAYDLSKVIWGNKRAVGKKESEDVESVKGEEKRRLSLFMGRATKEERVFIYGEDIFSLAGVDGEKEWHKLKVNELKLHLSLMEVKVEQAKLHDKIKRLKRKYGNIESTEKDGNEITFSKPNETYLAWRE